MKKFYSKQIILRSFLAGLGVFVWGIKIFTGLSSSEVLFCYTRDVRGNKTLIKDNGDVFVEDIFVMEIPKDEWKDNENTTVTIILEDEAGNRKTKTIELHERKP